MIRKNFMNGLLALVVAGGLLVAYNAFINSNSDSEKNATSKISSYLGLDKTKGEAKETATTVEVNGAATTSATDTPATTDTPAASSAAPVVQAPAAQPGVAKAAGTYTVKEGDTYGCIAEKYYGSFEHYTDVMNANPTTDTGYGEYGLFTGSVLSLPAVSQADLKPASALCS